MSQRLAEGGVLGRGALVPDLTQTSGTQVEHLSGSEGPRHDPYHYDKWVVKRNKTHIIGHFGLGVRVWVNGVELDLSEEELVSTFEKLVGVPMHILEQSYMRKEHTCKKCGCRETRSESGYPGEHFNVCVRCGEIVSTDFYESEII